MPSEHAAIKLKSVLRGLKPAQGGNKLEIPTLTAWRFAASPIQLPQTNSPYLYIVLDGTLRLHTPQGIMDYMPGQFFFSKIDTPLSGYVLTFSQQADFLALSVEFTINDIITAVLALDNSLTQKIAQGSLEEKETQTADGMVIEAVCRLLDVMERVVRSEFLYKNLLQEIIYYLLCGSCGSQLIQSIVNWHADEIYQANSWIKENFRSSFTVEELAEQRNMSVSLFHQKFKNATGMSPLQCQKRLRLTQARRLMLGPNKNVTQASLDVGYESLSQFIRDYKKMFGAAPKEDIQNIRKQLKK